MTITQNGINYICQNFGDTNFCCTDHGLSISWVDFEGVPGSEANATTASIVSYLASGLLQYLTMVNPSRGNFTQDQLNAANGGTVTLQDAITITEHDNPSEDQWCYILPPPCEDYTNQSDCETAKCYWYNDACHNSLVCSVINNQIDCENNGCHWWDDSCHSNPPPEDDYTKYILIAGAIMAIIGGYILIRKRKN